MEANLPVAFWQKKASQLQLSTLNTDKSGGIEKCFFANRRFQTTVFSLYTGRPKWTPKSAARPKAISSPPPRLIKYRLIRFA